VGWLAPPAGGASHPTNPKTVPYRPGAQRAARSGTQGSKSVNKPARGAGEAFLGVYPIDTNGGVGLYEVPTL